MDQTTLFIAVACLIAGLLLGAALTRLLSPQSAKNRDLRKKLLEKEDELKSYRRDVSEHFVQTAELLRELTRNQREVSEQLAVGAMRLTAPEISRKVHDTAFDGLAADSKFNILSSVPPEPPKDYAPSVPGGVLSENYGLTDLQDNSTLQGIVNNKSTSSDNDQDDDPTLKIS